MVPDCANLRKALLVLSMLAVALVDTIAAEADTLATESLFDLSLDDLLNLPVLVTTGSAVLEREAPGIVTVITAEDIKYSGARDLIDVLRLVPGIDFGSDVMNYTGLGIRGLYASEGKAAVYVDGLEVNELLFGTVAFGSRFSVDNIDRIEIIRGPGSVMYGGSAELAVINIINKRPAFNGTRISATGGAAKEGVSGTSGSFAMGHQSGALGIRLSGFFGEWQRSQGRYQRSLSSGEPFPMQDNSTLSDISISAGVESKYLDVSLLFDRYNAQNRDGYGDILAYPIDNITTVFTGQLRGDIPLGDRLRVSPEYTYLFTAPYVVRDPVCWGSAGARYSSRHSPALNLTVEPFDGLTVLAGGKADLDNAWIDSTEGYGYADSVQGDLPDGDDRSKSISYQGVAGFAQAVWFNKIVNVTAGVRGQWSSGDYSSVVPRLALTKALRNLNIKLLAAMAYKSPYMANMTTEGLKPENAVVLECEAGYRFPTNLQVNLNGFYIDIRDALIYRSMAGRDGYLNAEHLGSYGMEAQIKWKPQWLSADLGYSFYAPTSQSTMPEVTPVKEWFYDQPSQTPRAHLAFSPHKVSGSLVLKLGEIVPRLGSGFGGVSASLSGMWLSESYGYNIVDQDGIIYLDRFPSITLANLYFTAEPRALRGLTVGFGVFNLLDREQYFLTPYTTLYGEVVGQEPLQYQYNRAPLPGPPRQFVLKLTYSLRRPSLCTGHPGKTLMASAPALAARPRLQDGVCVFVY